MVSPWLGLRFRTPKLHSCPTLVLALISSAVHVDSVRGIQQFVLIRFGSLRDLGDSGSKPIRCDSDSVVPVFAVPI